MQTKTIERYFFFGILLATLIFTLLIFKPFWMVIILGISFTIVLYPIYKWMVDKKIPPWLSSLITVIALTIILCGPILLIGTIIAQQSQDVYYQIVYNGGATSFLKVIENQINNILPGDLYFNATEKASDFIYFISNNITKIFSSTLSAILSFLLMILSVFYFLKDGKRWKEALIRLSPLRDADDHKIIVKLSKTVNGVIKGYIFIAIIQGTLTGIGLTIFGVPNSVLWGSIAIIASLIPWVGTAVISIPAMIFLYTTGNTAEAIGLLIWSVALVATIDNFLNPILVGKKIKIPPLLILFSVLGGISVFGPIGILIGPLAVSLLYALISIYRNEFRQSSDLQS
ncbi:AI-2E family transporter [Patescibacteria group bacterium]|nr:AI-2E family transporter [Patescibacteria group bacterium]MBU1727987.1 AI-2E family transporter [Patescibacteria group bacterium]